MRDGGLLYGSPLLVLPVGGVSPFGTAGAAGAGAAAGLDLSGTGTVVARFGAAGFGDTILLVALPLVGGGFSGGALGAACADCARVLVLLRDAVATDGRPSATSAAALGSDAFGSGAAARQGGTTVAVAGLAGGSAAFGAGLETASLETWVIRMPVLCRLGGGAVVAFGTLSTISASTGAAAAASMKWGPDDVMRSCALSGGSSPSDSVAGALMATFTT